VDTVGCSNNRRGRPNYPVDFKERLAKEACEPGVSVSKLARQPGINANMLFKWRLDLREGLFAASESQSAHLLPVLVQRTPALPASSSITPSMGYIEIVIADAVVRVSAGTDAALLQIACKVCVHDRPSCRYQVLACRWNNGHACRDERPGRQSRDCVG
jgi:transposase